MIHTHRCGFTALGQLPGCGFEWQHETRVDWKLSEHHCPRCGRGPFTLQLEETTMCRLRLKLVDGVELQQAREYGVWLVRVYNHQEGERFAVLEHQAISPEHKLVWRPIEVAR